MITLLQGQTALLGPDVEARDTGWVISGNRATHFPCNPGTMWSQDEPLTLGKSYVVKYSVEKRISGSVRIILGTAQGVVRNANGIYEETIVAAGDGRVGFYSDGFLDVIYLSYYEAQDVTNAITVAFHEGDKGKFWTSYTYEPGMMIKFLNNFFSIKNGELWQYNKNPVYNTFFGVYHPYKITFHVNILPTSVKLFHGLRLVSNAPWEATDITIKPYPGKPFGMKSRLKKKKFVQLQGDWFADFLRNLLDPHFNDPINALMQGEELRGHIMEITIQGDSNEEMVLFTVDTLYTLQNYTL